MGGGPVEANVLGAVFLTGFELGARLGMVATPARIRELLAELIGVGPDLPPLEIREREMAQDIDLILEVARIVDDHCPDCAGRPLYDEGIRHLVCGGCGQLLQEDDQ